MMTYAYPCLSNPEYLCFQAEVGHYDIYKADRPCDTQDYDLHDEQEVGVYDDISRLDNMDVYSLLLLAAGGGGATY